MPGVWITLPSGNRARRVQLDGEMDEQQRDVEAEDWRDLYC